MSFKEVLIPEGNPFDPVSCPLCGQPLHLNYSSDQYLYASTSRAEMQGIRPRDLEEWEISCERGHVVMLPTDDGLEEHQFGVCRQHEPDEEHDPECGDHDFDRLRAMVRKAMGWK